MSYQTDDVLFEIPNEKLPKLAALYEEKATSAPYMISLVYMAIKWKQSEKFRKALIFTSPSRTWEQDGTIIAIMSCHCHDIFVFTLDDSQIPNIYIGLSKTKIIDFTKRTQFFAFEEKFESIIRRVIEEKNLKITRELPFVHFYGLPPEKARQLTYECPCDVYIKELDSSAADQISAVYPLWYPGIEGFVSDFIEINGGYGIFIKSTNELAAWVIRHTFGHVGLLQTEEKHKRKGYASILVALLSKQLGEEGYWSSATVVQNNNGAINTFENLGFRVVNNVKFITVE